MEGRSVKFLLEEKIFEGGFATCYRAVKNGVTGTLRAVKSNTADLGAYETLKKISADNNDIKNFVPTFDFFFNESKEVYIFCDDPKIVTFENICEKIRQSAGNENLLLLQVISAIKYLTTSIKTLHSAGLIHRDISPRNFGFKVLLDEVLTQAISLFDINTICQVGSNSAKNEIVGTEGFTEFGVANNLSDIFSIGATMFYALTGKIYNLQAFDDLAHLVDESNLLNQSKNLHPNLKFILTRILQNCLCSRAGRYRNCEALLADLDLAYYYVVPAELATRDAENWKQIEAFFKQSVKKDYFLPVRYHLWSRPLYAKKTFDTNELNVLVLGFGNYGQKFTDLCLALGQLPHTELNVHLFSKNELDFKSYIDQRPALKDFFIVNGKKIFIADESYGSIYYYSVGVESITQKFLQNVNPHYIFIALGNDQINFSESIRLTEMLSAEKISCAVNFVWEGHSMPPNCTAIPVVINGAQKANTHNEIERLAFNSHLLWQKNMQIDFEQLTKEFFMAYNYNSSVISAIHLRYKLHSLGIDWQDDESLKMVGEFEEMAQKKPDLIADLVAAEHRKWVCEKIFSGYKSMPIENCKGATHDKKRKTHVCMVRSRAGQPLEKLGLDEWDNMTVHELEIYDDLDQVSLRLHRFYRRQATELKKHNIFNDMFTLREMVSSSPDSLSAFNEWLACCKNLWDGTTHMARRRAYMYEGLRQKFLSSLNKLPTKIRELCSQKTASIHNSFHLIVESMKYYDLKNEDVKLVKEIPFVLTFNAEKITFAVPYQNDDALKNLAACAVINPKRAIFLVKIEDMKSYEAFKNSLKKIFKGVVDFCDQRKLRTNFDFVITYAEDSISIHRRKALEKILNAFGRIKKVNWIKDLQKYFAKYRGNKFFFVENLKVDNFPCYKFDLKTQSFDINPLCLVHKNQDFITVSESFALNNSVILSQNNPEFFDTYNAIWQLYKGDQESWLELCIIMPKIVPLVKIKKSYNDTVKLEYILPAESRISVERIFAALQEEKIISESRLITLTTSALKVFLTTSSNLCVVFEKLFGKHIYELMHPNDIEIIYGDGEISIGFNSLHVENLPVVNPKVISLLKSLQNLHYIMDLTISDRFVSFTYATRAIKKLMTDSKNIEITYFYHKALEYGTFSDIACDVIIKNGEHEQKNFDCVATKGFETFFINFSKNFFPIKDSVHNSTIINIGENVDVGKVLTSI